MRQIVELSVTRSKRMKPARVLLHCSLYQTVWASFWRFRNI